MSEQSSVPSAEKGESQMLIHSMHLLHCEVDELERYIEEGDWISTLNTVFAAERRLWDLRTHITSIRREEGPR